HRDLHSFPTRRSSDLPRGRPHPRAAGRGRRGSRGGGTMTHNNLPLRSSSIARVGALTATLLLCVAVVSPMPSVANGVPLQVTAVDRKSTRLNSSHDQI